jgi:hypothetical protein
MYIRKGIQLANMRKRGSLGNLVGLTICQIQSEYGKSKEIIHHESGQANQTHQLLESKYS